jgi:hypothetical protein
MLGKRWGCVVIGVVEDARGIHCCSAKGKDQGEDWTAERERTLISVIAGASVESRISVRPRRTEALDM